jgi:hypothetical protein
MELPRGYSSALRTEQAALTRSRIIDAARTAFVTDGFLGPLSPPSPRTPASACRRCTTSSARRRCCSRRSTTSRWPATTSRFRWWIDRRCAPCWTRRPRGRAWPATPSWGGRSPNACCHWSAWRWRRPRAETPNWPRLPRRSKRSGRPVRPPRRAAWRSASACATESMCTWLKTSCGRSPRPSRPTGWSIGGTGAGDRFQIWLGTAMADALVGPSE